MTRSTLRILAAIALALATQLAFGTDARPVGATVELSAEASHPAVNDLASATLYFQADDRNPAVLARQANGAIAAALDQTRAYPAVKVKTTGSTTTPTYAREGRRIEGWRIRADLQLESRDLTALSELLTKLQGTLALASLVMHPAPETRAKASDAAATEAIRAFQGRAQSIAGTLGKSYKIRQLVVTYGGAPRPIQPMARATAMIAEAAPMPIEAGESNIAVTVTGTIELSE